MPTTVVIVVDQVALPDFCWDLSAVAVEVKRALLFSSRAFYLLLFVGLGFYFHYYLFVYFLSLGLLSRLVVLLAVVLELL